MPRPHGLSQADCWVHFQKKYSTIQFRTGLPDDSGIPIPEYGWETSVC